MGIISPKCILAGNCKEEKGNVIVHETAGIFTRGCIFYFKADAMVATLVFCYYLSLMPTHLLFPSVLPDETSTLLRDLLSLYTSYGGLRKADPPSGLWGMDSSLLTTSWFRKGPVVQLCSVKLGKVCWSLLGSIFSKERATGSLSVILTLFLDPREEAHSPACRGGPPPTVRGTALKSNHLCKRQSGEMIKSFDYHTGSEARPTSAFPEREPVNVLEVWAALKAFSPCHTGCYGSTRQSFPNQES